jgi:hypothetical protein
MSEIHWHNPDIAPGLLLGATTRVSVMWPTGEQKPIVWHWCEPTNEDTAVHCRKGMAGHWCPWGVAAHTLVSREPLTLTPSLLLPCCGLHGFVTGGVWRGA